jgi:hypothetical protein
MSDTLEQVRTLVRRQRVRISDHGYDRLAENGILVREIVESLPAAEEIEDYPGFPKGPCVLVLQHDKRNRPFHAVWGIPEGQKEPAVLITAYRPDPEKWSADFRRRKP